jgi:hypothetical protein
MAVAIAFLVGLSFHVSNDDGTFGSNALLLVVAILVSIALVGLLARRRIKFLNATLALVLLMLLVVLRVWTYVDMGPTKRDLRPSPPPRRTAAGWFEANGEFAPDGR